MVPASMVSFSSRTRSVSIKRTAVATWMSTPAPLERPRGRGRQFRVELWQNPRASLEQPKVNLVAPDTRIKAQHIVGKRSKHSIR